MCASELIAKRDVPHPPLVRHVSLRPLSRDHYVGLVQAQRLVAAGSSETRCPKALLEDFLVKWHGEIAAHFDDEERLLIPLVDAEPDRQRLVQEHRSIRVMVGRLADDLKQGRYDPSAVKRLGESLYDHIRWEERVLFEAIQGSARPEDLEQLGRETARVEQSRNRKSCRNLND